MISMKAIADAKVQEGFNFSEHLLRLGIVTDKTDKIAKIIKNFTEYEPLDSTGKLFHGTPISSANNSIQLGKKKWSIENMAVMKLCAASMLSDRKYTKDMSTESIVKNQLIKNGNLGIFNIRQPLLSTNAKPFTHPNITNVQPAPCQRPDKRKVKIVGVKTVIKKIRKTFFKLNWANLPNRRAIGLYTYNMKKRVIVICQDFQKFVMFRARNGVSKLKGKRTPNIRPKPTAMSE